MKTPLENDDPGMNTDNEKTTPRDSSIITLKPYKPKSANNAQKKVQYSLIYQKLVSMIFTDQLNGPSTLKLSQAKTTILTCSPI